MPANTSAPVLSNSSALDALTALMYATAPSIAFRVEIKGAEIAPLTARYEIVWFTAWEEVHPASRYSDHGPVWDTKSAEHNEIGLTLAELVTLVTSLSDSPDFDAETMVEITGYTP